MLPFTPPSLSNLKDNFPLELRREGREKKGALYSMQIKSNQLFQWRWWGGIILQKSFARTDEKGIVGSLPNLVCSYYFTGMMGNDRLSAEPNYFILRSNTKTFLAASLIQLLRTGVPNSWPVTQCRAAAHSEPSHGSDGQVRACVCAMLHF